MLQWINTRWPGLRHKLLKPFIFKVNPNKVTLLALLVAIAAGLALWQQLLLLAALLIFLNGFLDILDGEIALRYGKSKRGDLLDHTTDRLADIAIIAGIIAGGFVNMLIGLQALVIILLVSFIGTEAQALTEKRLYAGLLGRADRLLLLAIGSAAEVLWPGSLLLIVIIVVVLSAITFGQRFATLWCSLR
ncbi:MAG: CDP-alcohol phosphatidyltransferase family protein [Candidatus Aenigmatarchaeota archaeon]